MTKQWKKIYNNIGLYRNTDSLLDTIKEVGLEVNPEETKYYMLMSRYERAGQEHRLKMANRFFEGVVNSDIWGQH
jgi:hypothetical protein